MRHLVIIDGQRIFAEAGSDWASPMWDAACANIVRLAGRFDSVIATRWVAPSASERHGSWDAYMRAWPFADRPASDPMFDLVPAIAALHPRVVDAPTFGKWDALRPFVGDDPELVLTGVSTDCCVVSTALPAADAGATLTVVTDACAGSSPENQAAALAVMGLYPPQITLATTAQVLR